MFTCPNAACKKTFDTPLKTVNLRLTPSRPYNACPFCLTKIADIETAKKSKPKQADNTVETAVQASFSEKNTNPASCNYHLGYLSERSQNGQIPDECLTCKDIVDCMLRKMR
ncbi:MAG: hypothetical protein NWE98_06025 [Candidatus Bathyarchaeota archaeon]|nr:hypothetical protein [Candidatus Bathyarchaeota archaeon]